MGESTRWIWAAAHSTFKQLALLRHFFICTFTHMFSRPSFAIAVFSAHLFISVNSAQSIPLPNHSFESPRTDFALPQIDTWERSPKPAWFQETPEQQWIFLTGVFKNTAPGSEDHIANMTGDQALFFFAYPEVALFQDYNSIGGTNTEPSHEFNALYEPGKRYELSLDLVGGGGNMKEGVAFEFSLYYRDATSNKVILASHMVTHSPVRFPNLTNFTKFNLSTPFIETNSPAAGKNIGVQLLSIVDFEDAGGYWDVDNLHLTATTDPSREIPVPNFSFESPHTEFALPQVDSWQRSPKPAWFTETPEQQWIFLTGVFQNTAATNSDHIPNIEGDQALFLFAQPEVAIFQDFNSVGGTNSAANQEFDAQYIAGRAYQLSAAVVGGGGNMEENVTLRLSLYYKDAASNMVTVASTTITNTPANFPNLTNLVDFHVMTPQVATNDTFAGKNIGIMIGSMANFENAGGYWDIDNIRLTEVATPAPEIAAARTGSMLQISWPAFTGKFYQLQVSDDLVDWTDVGAVVTGVGRTELVELSANGAAQFVQVEEVQTP
jgi:hypothetical protein